MKPPDSDPSNTSEPPVPPLRGWHRLAAFGLIVLMIGTVAVVTHSSAPLFLLLPALGWLSTGRVTDSS